MKKSNPLPLNQETLTKMFNLIKAEKEKPDLESGQYTDDTDPDDCLGRTYPGAAVSDDFWDEK